MCGAMVGCVVCEGYAFFIKKMHVYLISKTNRHNFEKILKLTSIGIFH